MRSLHPFRSGLFLALLGCAAARPALTPSATVTVGTMPRAAADGEDAKVGVEIPARLRWVSATLGPPSPTVVVSVANPSATALDVSGMRVTVEALREGTAFRCEEAGAAVREPTVLRPGGAHRFTRTLDCELPLVGTYELRVRVRFGHGAWAEPRDVRTFSLKVDAARDAGPRRVVPIPGLWAALGTSNVLLGSEAPAASRMVLTLINAGPTPLELPRFRLALRVYRAGSPIPCEDAPLELATPAVLGVGDIHRERVAISCLGLDVSGRYEIVPRLQIPDANEIELSRIGVEVTSDPARRIPAVP